MNSFGDNLRREREARGISLKEVSAQTKIGVKQLKAIEDEELDQLPGGIFTKSFLRQYARFLRVDEEFIVGEYLKLAGLSTEPSIDSLQSPRTEPHADFGTGSERIPFSSYSVSEEASPSILPRIALVATCAAVLVGGIFYGVRAWKTRKARISAPAAVQAKAAKPAQPVSALAGTAMEPAPEATVIGPPAPQGLGASGTVGISGASGSAYAATASTSAGPAASAGVQTSGARAASGSAAPLPSLPAAVPATGPVKPAGSEAAAPPSSKIGVELAIAASREVWMSITSDGQKQFQGNLKAGESRRVEAKESVKLTLGDAGAVTMTMNGQQLPPAGRSGEVKTITVSAKSASQ